MATANPEPRVSIGARLRYRVSRLPPHGPFFEDGLGVKPERGIFGFLGQFFVAAKNDHTDPVVVVHDLVRFDAHQWIGAHPFDLLSDRGETVQTVGFVGEVDRDDVWLIVSRASEPAQPEASEQVPTHLRAHFLYQHGSTSTQQLDRALQ